MDWDEDVERQNLASSIDWIRRFEVCRRDQLTAWVSGFHKDRLACKLAHDDLKKDLRGSFNWACKVIFTDGEAWLVRFPIQGKVKKPDEKVEIEVATMAVISELTDIPIPEVKAWGLSRDNALGLGPFIMTAFVEGVNLGEILPDPESRLVRTDVSDDQILVIYRQIARIVLQLSKLDFPRIGSLSRTSTPTDICTRPLTWKAHEILHVGGVDVFCSPTTTFSSTTDYFRYVADQDLQHLKEQRNSVDDASDARLKFVNWNICRELVDRFVLPEYDTSPFKLVCDDFGPTNILVNNTEDLKIVAVVDWEWSYAGPYQLFCSPPRWLMLQRPNIWSCEDDRLVRYQKYLALFLTALEEQEGDIPEADRVSTVMKKLQRGGGMWFHHIMWEGFNGPENVPFSQLRQFVPNYEELAANVKEADVQAFVEQKMQDLEEYGRIMADYEVLT